MASAAPRRHVVTDKPVKPRRPNPPGAGTLSNAKEKIHKFMEQRANETRQADKPDAASASGSGSGAPSQLGAGMEPAKDMKKQIGDEGRKKLDQQKDDVGNKVENAKDMKKQIGDEGRKKLDQQKDDVGNEVENVEETGKQMGDKAREGAEDMGKQMGDKAREGAGDMGKQIEEEGREGAEDMSKQMEEEGREGAEEMGKQMEEEGREGAEDMGRQMGDEAREEMPTDEVEEEAENAEDHVQYDLSILDGREVQEGGKVFDDDGNLIGEVAEGNPEDLVGQTVNAEGEIIDEDGDLIGVVNLVQQGSEVGEKEGAPQADMGEAEDEAGGIDLPAAGEEAGEATREQAPKPEEGITGDEQAAGEVGGVLPDEKPELEKPEMEGEGEALEEQKPPEVEGALPDISTLEGLKCNKFGNIVNADGTVVGELVEGDAKKLARDGCQLDAQGQFWDNQGHVIGRAKVIPVEEEEQGPFADSGDIYVAEDGWVKDEGGRVVGKVVEGDAKKLVGRAVDDDGDILDKRGNVIGRAEPYEEPEEEEQEEEEEEEGQDLSALEGLTVNKLGNILDNNGVLIGRIAEGNPKKLAGKKVDAKGQIWSDAGKVIGQAELIPADEREKPEGPFYGFEGLTVGDEGTIVDSSGEVIGRLVEGDAERLKGRAVDEDGEIIDKLGNVIGRAERWKPEEPELSPEELEKQRKEKEDEDLAKKMCAIVQRTLDSVGPICRQIMQHIEKANQTPKDELDEEELVKQVKPLIEEAANALQECKGALRALDPDGRIAETAKARSATHEATPAEQHLADLLKELAQTVAETIDNGRRLIADMPHAKKELNPLWALLSEPLFQIIAAVGLLLSGVLGLVSRLLDGLGLGGILRGLLGNLGLDKLLEGFGLGTVTQALGLEGKK